MKFDLVGGERQLQRLVHRQQQHELLRRKERGAVAGKSSRAACRRDRARACASRAPSHFIHCPGAMLPRGGARRGDVPVDRAQAVHIEKAVAAVGQGAIAFAGHLAGRRRVGVGDDGAEESPGEPLVGGGRDRHCFVRAALVVVAVALAMHEADRACRRSGARRSASCRNPTACPCGRAASPRAWCRPCRRAWRRRWRRCGGWR